MKRREDEAGLILVNVLMFVAIASGLVLLLISREELALDRGLRMREASRALAVARGGELSALAALRRDARQAGNIDHGREEWASVAASGARIEGGTFDLAVADAEARFNVNLLRSGQAPAVELFREIAAAGGFGEEDTVKAIELVRLTGPVTDLRPLRLAGFDPAMVARIEPMVTALPGDTTINLNSADEALLAILFKDPYIARRLVQARERKGYLTFEDLADQKVLLPWGAAFRSSTFWVRTRATIGATRQQTATLVRRVQAPDGTIDALPVERWRNAAVPPEAPAFPAPR